MFCVLFCLLVVCCLCLNFFLHKFLNIYIYIYIDRYGPHTHIGIHTNADIYIANHKNRKPQHVQE